MIGGLPISAIQQLRGRQDAPAAAGLAGQPMPVQSAPAAGNGLSQLILAKLLQRRGIAAPQQPGAGVPPPVTSPGWRDQPIYLGGDPRQTYNSMGGLQGQQALMSSPGYQAAMAGGPHSHDPFSSDLNWPFKRKNASPLQDIYAGINAGQFISPESWAMAGYGPGGAALPKKGGLFGL